MWKKLRKITTQLRSRNARIVEHGIRQLPDGTIKHVGGCVRATGSKIGDEYVVIKRTALYRICDQLDAIANDWEKNYEPPF